MDVFEELLLFEDWPEFFIRQARPAASPSGCSMKKLFFGLLRWSLLPLSVNL